MNYVSVPRQYGKTEVSHRMLERYKNRHAQEIIDRLNSLFTSPLLIDGHRIHLSPSQIVIFRLLFATRGGLVSSQDIFAAIYGNPADGGPVSFERILASHFWKMRQALAVTRFRIRCHRECVIRTHGPRVGGYYLERI